MKFSSARELITPSIKTTMSGYAGRSEEFKTIHDDLYVKCVYMENNDTKSLIIAFDLLQYNYILNEQIFDYIKSIYHIKKENVIISYSHTHAGPKISSYTERFDDSPLHDYYIQRTKLCIDRAFLSIQEGNLYYTVTSGRWNVNRRRVLPDGSIALAPNYEGIKDEEVSLLIIKDSEGTIKVVLHNYSCHPVTLSATLHISGEFPGRINQLIEANYYGSHCLFLQGAAGNMRPIIAAYKDKFNACTFAQVDEMAKSIVNTIQLAINQNDLEEISPTFKGSSFIIKPKIHPLNKEFFEKRLPSLPTYLAKTTKNLIEHFNEQTDEAIIHSGFIKLTEDLYIVYMGGEICYEVKLLIKKVFEGKRIIFLGYHEALTYIPSDTIINEGGYEGIDAPTFSGFRGPFELGIDKTITDAFKKELF